MTPEEYIKAYTRGNSNELVGGGYHEWLTPENALAAVELAREEMMKNAKDATIRMGRAANFIEQSWELDDYLQTFHSGQKVKVIIIKE